MAILLFFSLKVLLNRDLMRLLNKISLEEIVLELLNIFENSEEGIEFFNYAESLFLPRLLLLARIALPDFEEFLFLKPCLFFLFLFDIFTVTFIFIFPPKQLGSEIYIKKT